MPDIKPSNPITKARQPSGGGDPPDPPDPPELLVWITSPKANDSLSASREGREDVVSLEVENTQVTLTNVGLDITQGDLKYSVLGNAATKLVNVKFLRAGPATLVGYAKGKTFKGIALSAKSSSVEVVVTPTGRIGITIQIDDPLSTPGSVPVMVPPTGKNLRVVVTSPIRPKRVECSIDEWNSTITLASPQGATWESSIPLSKEAPKSYSLLVRDVDFFDEATLTRIAFSATENAGPEILVEKPHEDAVLVTSAFPFIVPLNGTVRDLQSGYKTGSLSYSYAGRTVPISVSNGAWSIELSVTSYGPHTVAFRAQDNLENSTTILRQFKVVSSYKPKTIDELLSPRAYLHHLLEFVGTHVRDKPEDDAQNQSGNPINPDQLSAIFKQPFGLLAQPDQGIGDQILNDLHIPVSIMRQTRALDRGAQI